jgi:hypothetical protein
MGTHFYGHQNANHSGSDFFTYLRVDREIKDNELIGHKKKVKQSHYTPQRCLGEEEYSSYSFTTSALDGGEWSASWQRFTPQGKDLQYPLDRRLGGSQSWSGHRG